MTPTQQNIAIAETQGFKPQYKYGGSGARLTWWVKNGIEYDGNELPNYHGSLDAIVPVVRDMPRAKKMAVIQILSTLAGSDHFTLATPAQWCEAALRAKGLRR